MLHVKKLSMLALVSMLVLSLLVLSVSAARPDESRTLKVVHTNPDFDGYQMPYTLYLPTDYDETASYPTLLLLHGAGERGNDNELQLFHGVDELYTTRPELMNQAIFIVPQCPLNEQWVDWPWANGNYSVDEIPESKALSTAMQILSDVTDNYAVDENRIYIMGISMGGFGAWDALVRHESTFAAGVPLCGGGDPTKSDILKEIPIWCVHGTADTAVPFAGTEEMYNTIVAAGGERITFEQMRDMGHWIWDYATTNGAMIDWLFSQNLELRYPPEPETDAVTEPLTESLTDTDAVDNIDTEAKPMSTDFIVAICAIVIVGGICGFLMAKKKK